MSLLSITHKVPFLFVGISLLVCIGLQSSTVCACSSRAIPKPRPSSATSSISATPSPTTAAPITTTPTTTTTTTVRPNITFPTYKCPTNYDAWYCLNDATCFSIKLGDSVMYNCECAVGFMGPRCEYKEIDGSYLPKRPGPMLEKASIASGATCALIFMLVICLTLYLRYDQRSKTLALHEGDDDYYDDVAADEEDIEQEYEDVCFGRAAAACRFCNDMRCCGDASGGLLAAEYRALSLRQHIKTVPLSVAIKRSTKL